MYFERVFAKHHRETVSIFLFQVFQDPPHNRAGQAFKIAKLFQDDAGIRIAAQVHRVGARPAVVKNDSGRGWLCRGRRNYWR